MSKELNEFMAAGGLDSAMDDLPRDQAQRIDSIKELTADAAAIMWEECLSNLPNLDHANAMVVGSLIGAFTAQGLGHLNNLDSSQLTSSANALKLNIDHAVQDIRMKEAQS